MTAGTGIRHSEFNHNEHGHTHFLQIWLLPSAQGLTPGYEQKTFDPSAQQGRLQVVAQPGGAQGALSLNADARLSLGRFDGPDAAELPLEPARLSYVFVVRGQLHVNGHALKAGDAATLDGEPLLHLAQGQGAEVLVFDLAR